METAPLLSEIPQDQLDAIAAENQARLEANMEKVGALEAKLGALSITQAQRDGAVYRAAEVHGQRQTIDPHTPPGREVLRGGFIAELITRPVTNQYAGKRSVHVGSNWPNGKPEYDPSEASILTNFRDMFSAKRSFKQGVRQVKAERSQRVSGANVGLGVEAGIATKIARTKHVVGTLRKLSNGEIAGDVASHELRNRKRISITKTAQSTNMRRRKERRGALINGVLAGQPIASRVRTWRVSRVENKLDRTEHEFRTLNQQRIQFMLEKERREEDED